MPVRARSGRVNRTASRSIGDASRIAIRTIPAPILGWNVRDQLTAMKPEDAVTLDNLIPGPLGVALRNGFAEHATGLESSIGAIMAHSAPDGDETLFAAAGTNIFDVTAEGAVGAASVADMTSARWQHIMFGTAGGNFLYIVNGSDPARYYDGSTWTEPTINNVSSSALINIASHHRRIWFVQKDTLDAWYLGANSIAGDATRFNIGPFCKRGGHLRAIASWTRDSGAGPDDVLVFITSKGEAVVYAGTDPDSASTWNLQGVYRTPEPIGHRCVLKLGGDLALLTSQGFVSFTGLLSISESATDRVSATDRITGAFEEAYIASGSVFGWQAIEHPRRGLVIVNVPDSTGTTAKQFVLNSNNPPAWCRFTGINAKCWELMGDNLFFGDDSGTVYRITDAYLDNGEPISALMQTAFNSFGSPVLKTVTQVRPVLEAATGTDPPVEIRVDYSTAAAQREVATVVSSGPDWDEPSWDTVLWGPNIETVARWQAATGCGQVISALMSLTSENSLVVNHIDVMYQRGGPM